MRGCRAVGGATARRLAAFAALGLLCGCNEEIVVRVATRVYPDGSVARRIELAGRDENGQVPAEADWLEKEAGVTLADAGLWRSVERGPGRFAAEGVWPSASDMPACLEHAQREDLPRAVDRCSARLAVDDLVVLRRYRYEETWGDPLGAEAARKALDRLIDLAVEALGGELKRQFGESFDTSGAERLLRGEGRKLLEEEIAASRRTAREPEPARRAAWSAVLKRHAVAVASSEGAKYWQRQTPPILDWLRTRVAASLSTPDRRLAPEELTFWPAEDSLEETTRDVIQRTWGDEKGIEKELDGLLTALQGWYSSSSARYRFLCRVAMPGRILFTNGTLEGREEGADAPAAAVLFRGEDLVGGEVVLRAASVTLDDEALRGLGARREFDARHLAEVVDLLTERDPAGLLLAALRRAAAKGRIELLRKDDSLPPDVARLARELADQLDPAVGPPFG